MSAKYSQTYCDEYSFRYIVGTDGNRRSLPFYGRSLNGRDCGCCFLSDDCVFDLCIVRPRLLHRGQHAA